jgi:hypothetical protein
LGLDNNGRVAQSNAAGTKSRGGSRRKSTKKKAGSSKPRKKTNSGKLRIGDHWNAITIIALSQNNPLKAIAEFVENSIDARARHITIVRGRERGELYLKVIDDGEGIPLSEEGLPNFRYVATHICDSLKKRLKEQGAEGIQGEFGIGLLSFWTVGERLLLSSAGADGRAYQMEMKKGESGYSINQRRILFSHPGTELMIHPLLPGIRQLNGERIQHYLASELRDRIRRSGVEITITDRYSRKELEVKPREYTGRLLHELEVLETAKGEIYLELYLNPQDPGNAVSLYRSGTRVLPSINRLDLFDKDPWTSGYLQGSIDAPFLQLTPGTRDGIIHDENLMLFSRAIEPVEQKLTEIVEREKQAEEEEASRRILKTVQHALKEAFLALPPEDYDWFDIYAEINKKRKKQGGGLFDSEGGKEEEQGPSEEAVGAEKIPQKVESGRAEPETREFYEYPGPLYKAIISPASSIVGVRQEKTLRCVARDKKGRTVEEGLEFDWSIKEGEGTLSSGDREIVTFVAPEEPGLVIVECTVRQGDASCSAESIITVTESLVEQEGQPGKEPSKGLPGYTYLRAPGELWRSRYDVKNNLIVINNGHADYLFASQKRARKLKYICRLFAKELVLNNFRGFNSGELLERMIELSLYTEEHLR